MTNHAGSPQLSSAMGINGSSEVDSYGVTEDMGATHVRTVPERLAKDTRLQSGPTIFQHAQKRFGPSILAALAFAATLIAQPVASQGSALGDFRHCIDGTASDAEAEEVGLTLGRRFY
jgi:hypothetical protein